MSTWCYHLHAVQVISIVVVSLFMLLRNDGIPLYIPSVTMHMILCCDINLHTVGQICYQYSLPLYIWTGEITAELPTYLPVYVHTYVYPTDHIWEVLCV